MQVPLRLGLVPLVNLAVAISRKFGCRLVAVQEIRLPAWEKDVNRCVDGTGQKLGLFLPSFIHRFRTFRLNSPAISMLADVVSRLRPGGGLAHASIAHFYDLC